MARGILLVDAQVDVRKLLHSALDTLKNPEIEVFEAGSGEEGAAEFARRSIHLLVVDQNLPDISGIEFMHQVRSGRPDIKVILLTRVADRKIRDEMLNAGATAVFEKPVPLADFLDAAERGLGLARTIFPTDAEPTSGLGQVRVADLLANLRQDIRAEAVFLINARGRVVARAGDLRDSSTEVSLISALTAIFSAGLKVAKSNRQEVLTHFSVFTGGDDDLILMTVNESYALLLASNSRSSRKTLFETLQAMRAARVELDKSLRALGAQEEGKRAVRQPNTSAEDTAEAPEIEELLKSANGKRLKAEELNLFWDRAAAASASGTASANDISYEEARKMGLTREDG
jgi:DNA-binding response OmpR family regulator